MQQKNDVCVNDIAKKYSNKTFQVERDDNDDGLDVLSLSRTSCPLGLPIVELRKRSAELSEFDQVKNLTWIVKVKSKKSYNSTFLKLLLVISLLKLKHIS